MKRHNFRNLQIWLKGLDIVDCVYEIVNDLPKTERYNLINQSIRSACSIPANIAEGSGKKTPKAFSNYLDISLSSSYELETHLIICKRRKFGNSEKIDQTILQLHEEQRMITSFQNKIDNDSGKGFLGILFLACGLLFSLLSFLFSF